MLDKIFSKKIVVPFFSGIGTVAIFQWIVFPGLTAADTFLNIFAGIIGFFTLVFVYYSLGLDVIVKQYTQSEIDEKEKERMQILAGIKQHDSQKGTDELVEIFTKINEGSTTKSETKADLEKLVVKETPKMSAKPKTEKVMGEYQLNNKEKVRKSLYKPKTK